jgi:hypothetical protein
MIIILGLIILVAAVVVGAAGVLSNDGSAHTVAHFSVLGYHLTGSSGTVFLSGIVVGAAGLLGLSLLLAGARRTSRRGSAARRGLRQSRRETAAASQQRDDLIEQRDTARANTASNLSHSTAAHDASLSRADDRGSKLRDIWRRLTPAHTAPQSDASASRPVPDMAAISPASDVPADKPEPDGAPIPPAPDVPVAVSAPAD